MEKIFSKGVRYVLAILLIVILAACGGEGAVKQPQPDPQPSPEEPSPEEPSEPAGTYDDPGTPPPAPITEPTVMTSASLMVSDETEGLVTLNVAGFSVDGSAALSTENLAATLEAEDFTVVEGEVVQGIVVKEIESDDEVPADIAFVIDTTGTMKDALSSVQEGIIDFASTLASSGLDVRLGAVTFGDAFDTLGEESRSSGISISGEVPPGFDDDERPSFALTDDLFRFQAFIAEQVPIDGRDTPENVLGALAFAHDKLEWREGAQRIVVVVTDTCSHTEESRKITEEPWAPGSVEDVLSEVRTSATVHVIGSRRKCRNFGTANMSVFTGAEGTGGMFYPWESGDFDLSQIGLTQTVTNNYLITYRGELNGQEKDVRLVIDNGEGVQGELTLKATY